MSTNIQVKRVCEFCGELFTARTTVTRFCTHRCNQRAYKANAKKEKIQQSNIETSSTVIGEVENGPQDQKPLLTVKEMAAVICVSERTLFRLIKQEEFPRIRMGRRLLFRKDIVLDFITTKFGSI